MIYDLIVGISLSIVAFVSIMLIVIGIGKVVERISR